MSDLTGRQQFSHNVIIGWSVQLFVIAVGFIVPRQINDNLGTELLGVWDLGWVAVSYLSVSNLGMGTSVTRYGAMYRAQNDFEALSRVVTTVTVWQMGAAVLTAGMALLFALSVPFWVSIPDGISVFEVEIALFLLGLSLSVNSISNSAAGLLAAYHRWDISHTINGLNAILQGVGMLLALLLGGGLVEMACAVIVIATGTTIARILFARRVAPEIRLKRAYWDWKTAKKMLGFGGKTLIGALPQLLLFQTLAVVVTIFAGPAVLAHLNRGIALVRQVGQMIRRVARMFLPMTGGLLGLDRREEAINLILESGKYGTSVTLPMVIIFISFGDMLLKLWMGEGFDNWLMMTLLALAMLFPISYAPVSNVIVGLNAHGKIAIYNLIATVVSFLLAAVVVSIFFQWTVISAASVLAFSWPVGGALIIPFYIKHRFQIHVTTFMLHTFLVPLVCCIPMLSLMPVARYCFINEIWAGAVLCFVIAGVAQTYCYYRWVLSDFGKDKVNQIVQKLGKFPMGSYRKLVNK